MSLSAQTSHIGLLWVWFFS